METLIIAAGSGIGAPTLVSLKLNVKLPHDHAILNVVPKKIENTCSHKNLST